MQKFLGTAVGKSVRQITNLRGSGGQALPGLIVERLFPSYLAHMLAQLPDGVVVITGTNGKTTTTKMVVELLQSNGKRVLTNPTGSNFTRGVIASLSQQAKMSGKLPFDIGVFELDEAYAQRFVQLVKPRWVLALNVMRDQLDRFGELDTVAKLIGSTMEAATEGIVVNGDDARLIKTAATIHKDQPKLAITHFGVSHALRKFFPVDDEIVAVGGKTKAKRIESSHARAVELSAFDGQNVSYDIAGTTYTAKLALSGQHNFQNAAAALALVGAVAPDIDAESLVESLAQITPAFGRGEIFKLKNGSTLQLILVKNPAGFRQTMASYPVAEKQVMFAVNDNYADSRDVSWLWDVDFSDLAGKTVPLTSGSRAADMALRLSYDDVQVGKIAPDIDTALAEFCKLPEDKLLITTYTAMLRFYKLLKTKAGTSL